MKSRIQIDKIKDYLSTGGKIIENIGLYLYGESLNQAGEKAFEEAIELGITNTISALYEAKVQDDEIIRVVNEYWGIDKGECLDRLLWEKTEACVRTIKHQLQLQGLSSKEISNFMLANKVRIKLKHNNALWLLKNSPSKLIDSVIEKNKRLNTFYKQKNYFTPPTLAQNRVSQFNSVTRFQEKNFFHEKIK